MRNFRLLKPWILGTYGLSVGLAILGSTFQHPYLHYFTKPLMMPLLLLWYSQYSGAFRPPRLFFSIGFLCGWLGDIFLIDTSGRYFLWGLGSFLVGHFFYIIGFRKIVKQDTLSLRLKYLSLSTTLIFFAGVAVFLAPAFQSSERKPLLLPVLFYCLVICVMAWYAWFSWRNQQGFLMWAFVGALLFVISDFCIALNFFVLPQGLPFPDLIILSTYGLAQAFIAQGTTALQPMN
ncbi:MAG: lysoplasmalogenase [Flavobacteriales bacterium]|nr:lysoplasmalogenase [Flavobacteriales bacterium]